MYKIIFRGRSLRYLKRNIHPQYQTKILEKIENLGKDPFSRSLDTKKLSGFEGLEKAYRLRVGRLRVIYELDTTVKTITIYEIDYRRTTTY